MTTQQLHLFNCLYLAVLVVVAFLTRATARRIAGALAVFFNVGREGKALGVKDNTTLTAFQVLLDVNQQAADAALYPAIRTSARWLRTCLKILTTRAISQRRLVVGRPGWATLPA